MQQDATDESAPANQASLPEDSHRNADEHQQSKQVPDSRNIDDHPLTDGGSHKSLEHKEQQNSDEHFLPPLTPLQGSAHASIFGHSYIIAFCQYYVN